MPFVTISSYNNSSTTQDLTKKRRREDEAIDSNFGIGGCGSAVVGSGGGSGGLFGNGKVGETEMDKSKPTVRLIIPLSEPNELASSEFNYRDLVHSTLAQVRKRGATWWALPFLKISMHKLQCSIYTSSFYLN